MQGDGGLGTGLAVGRLHGELAAGQVIAHQHRAGDADLLGSVEVLFHSDPDHPVSEV